MAKLLLDYSDGLYSTHNLSDAEATKLESQGTDVTHVEDRVLDAWHRHCDEGGAWQALWRAISNEQYMRRREHELLPLEEAQREIERLREELLRAQRMERFYENRYVKQLSERHREEHIQFTCVFPQPGCQIDVLPSECHERAQEILEQYNTEHAADGMKWQGCCCGHSHKKLNDATVNQLRSCGFLIEHDSESEERT